MPSLLFELGTEEIPAASAPSALAQLRKAVAEGLAAEGLAAESVECAGTPRRLIVLARGVPERQEDEEREVRGPSRAVAFDSAGQPTGAAIGFARKQGVDPADLRVVETEQGEYVAASIKVTGKPAADVIGPLLQKAVSALTFPKMMRWGTNSPRFVRPIRWIVALLGSKVIPMEIAGVASGNRTRGHRYSGMARSEGLEVASAEELLPLLQSAQVMTSPEARRAEIRKQADALAAEAGGRIPWDEGLLDENVWLVEWPTALLGRFDGAYLDLPRPVLVTAMKKHQRFFPVEDASGKLLPCFVSVRNGDANSIENVRMGNERVLSARFADARYFHEEDRKSSLDEFAASLDRLVFQEKLGSMAGKRQRLIRLARASAAKWGFSSDEQVWAIRAAELCKADLVSRMVVELPALQGIIGREYALASGEHEAVAAAIAEHYQPRSTQDSIAPSRAGKLLAVCDRMDTLCGYVGMGILPSGSSDPYGLRRAAQGLLLTLEDEPNAPSLDWAIREAVAAYREESSIELDGAKVSEALLGLFGQRLDAALLERGLRYDLAQAAVQGGGAFRGHAAAGFFRGEFLRLASERVEFALLVQTGARIANILKGHAKAAPPSDGMTLRHVQEVLHVRLSAIDSAQLTEPAERALFEAAGSALERVAAAAAGRDGKALLSALEALAPAANGFFDNVMVMTDDLAVRENRLALLAFCDALFRLGGDFTAVVLA